MCLVMCGVSGEFTGVSVLGINEEVHCHGREVGVGVGVGCW